MARSTFPMAFPSTEPTARPTCLALRVALVDAAVAFFDFRTTCLTTFLAFVVAAPAADFVVRLMARVADPTFRRAEAFREDVLRAPVVFFAAIFFKGVSFLKVNDDHVRQWREHTSLNSDTQDQIHADRIG